MSIDIRNDKKDISNKIKERFNHKQIGEEEIHYELQQILKNIEENISNDEFLLEQSYEVVQFENEDANGYLCRLNIINRLINLVSSNINYLNKYLFIVKSVSKNKNSQFCFSPSLLDFLFSYINPQIPLNIEIDIVNIIGNFACSDKIIASKITQKGCVDNIISLLELHFNDELNDDIIDFFCENISFLGDIIDIEQFQPVNQFTRIINVGLFFIEFDDEEILDLVLTLFENATYSNNFHLFLKAYKENRNNRNFNEEKYFDEIFLIKLILQLTNSSEESISSKALNILVNVTRNSDYGFNYKIYISLKEDLITYLTNSIQLFSNNFSAVVWIIGNMIETKESIIEFQTDQGKTSTPIFDYFFNLILQFILMNNDYNIKFEDKEILSHLFAVTTEVMPTETKGMLISNQDLISSICCLFHSDPETDFNIICGLDNLLVYALSLQFEQALHLAQIILSSISLDELNQLFEGYDDDDTYEFVYRRDEFIEHLNNLAPTEQE